jgi:hypothetical protein
MRADGHRAPGLSALSAPRYRDPVRAHREGPEPVGTEGFLRVLTRPRELNGSVGVGAGVVMSATVTSAPETTLGGPWEFAGSGPAPRGSDGPGGGSRGRGCRTGVLARRWDGWSGASRSATAPEAPQDPRDVDPLGVAGPAGPDELHAATGPAVAGADGAICPG